MESKFEDHVKEARELYPINNIVGVFLQGSQNYGLEVEDSDVDTKCILTPSFHGIAMNSKPISTTHVRENDEHIDLKDVRLLFKTFRKQNINFIEVLFTKYRWLNPLYEEQWMRLINKREEIAHMNLYAALKAMKGTALEKYHALEHPYPAKLEILAQWGYDPKQLHHLIRIREFILRYLGGVSYEECLRPCDLEYLKAVKMGYHSLDEARSLAAVAANDCSAIVDQYCSTHEPEENKEVVNLLDDVQYQIMEISVEMELFGDGKT